MVAADDWGKSMDRDCEVRRVREFLVSIMDGFSEKPSDRLGPYLVCKACIKCRTDGFESSI
jgi:hypothetical protein